MLDITIRSAGSASAPSLPYNAAVIRACMRALSEIDVQWLRDHPDTPELYRSGVRYISAQRGPEIWADIPTALAAGGGDCKVLAAWRVAELRCAGVNAHCALRAHPRADGTGITYHVVVEWPDGRVEDPSIMLGAFGEG